jgi:hypothetical protein
LLNPSNFRVTPGATGSTAISSPNKNAAVCMI